MSEEKLPPSIDDDRAWARGFNDWLAFGDKANALVYMQKGFDDYERGKKDASRWFFRKEVI